VAGRARAFYMRGPMTAGPTLETRLKMLSYRAWRRGIRETDLILGPFADAHLAGMTPGQLDAFEALLDQPDQDLYAWVKGAPAPAAFEGEILTMIRAFRPGAADLSRGA
jgi:antitoxin CptB